MDRMADRSGVIRMLKCFRQTVVQMTMAIVPALIVTGAAQAADVTFFVCSDTHYRATAQENRTQTAGVELINTLPGAAYPDALGGGPSMRHAASSSSVT